MNSIATEEELRSMINWFGTYLDRWMVKHANFGTGLWRPEEWLFCSAYNLIELFQAINTRVKYSTAISIRDEIKLGLGQTIMCLFMVGKTFDFLASDLIFSGCQSFQNRSIETGRIKTVMGKLRCLCQKQQQHGMDVGGNQEKVLGKVKK